MSRWSPPLPDGWFPVAYTDELEVRERRRVRYFDRWLVVQRGETLSSLTQRMGIDDEPALRFLRSEPSAREIVRVAPGKFVQAEIDKKGMSFKADVVIDTLGHPRVEAALEQVERQRARRDEEDEDPDRPVVDAVVGLVAGADATVVGELDGDLLHAAH